jgi:hypothetical protein
VAVNAALVVFASTSTVDGTETALSLLSSETSVPPAGAAAFRVTVQASVPAPIIVDVLQLKALRAGIAAVPVPLRLMVAELLLEVLATIVN